MYNVYCGSYVNEQNAFNQAFKLFCDGYDVICVKHDINYRLLVGSFGKLNDANRLADLFKAKGYGTFIEKDGVEKEEWQLSYLTQKRTN